MGDGGGWGGEQCQHLRNSGRGGYEQLSDMPKPLSNALGSCMKLPARDPMTQLLSWLTFGLAELPKNLVGWVSVALAHAGPDQSL